MPMEDEVAYALIDFVEGSKLHGKGLLLSDKRIQDKGLDIIKQATDIIVRHIACLDVLLPLLKHPDPSVRLNTCCQLFGDHYDVVLPVLHDLDENCVTEASWGAAMLLQMHGEPNTGSGFKKPEFAEPLKPRFPRR